MSIKDFIKIASVFGEETKKQVQLKEDKVDDALKDLLGIDDQETIDQIKDIADTAPKVQTDAPKLGDNDTTSQDSNAPGTSSNDSDIPRIPVSPNDTSTVGDDSDDDSTSVDDADSADSGTPSTGGSLLGRKLDTTTPNLMKAYNDGGKQAMPEIRNLQTALSRLGHDPNGIDGKYGQGTFAAVQAFQKANGLQADGMAGPNTMAAMKKALDDKFEKNKVSPDDAATDNQAQADTAGPNTDAATDNQAQADTAQDQGNANYSNDAQASVDKARDEIQRQQDAFDDGQTATAPSVQSDVDRFEELLQKSGRVYVSASYDFSSLLKLIETQELAEELSREEQKELRDLYKKIQGYVGTEGGQFDKKIEKLLNDYLQYQKVGKEKIKQNAQQTDQKAQDATPANPTTDTRDGDDLGTAPTAPKISDERGMQSGGSIVNFNVSQFKSNGTYIDIPDRNNPGFVVRVYGPEANLQAFIDKDPRGKGKTIQGGTKQSGAPDAERDAKERGVQVAHKEYDMTKKINEASMNISMNGNNAAEVAELIGILKNAGMSDAAPVSDMPMYKDGHDDMVSKMQMMDEPPAETPCGMGEEAVDEDWDNTPDETYADHHTMTKDLSGGINRRKPKGSERAKDPAVHQTVETSIKDQLWAALNEKMATEGRGRGRGKNKKMKEVDIKTTEGRGKGNGRGRGKG